MNEFLFRLLNTLAGRSEIVDWLLSFLAQPGALLATVGLALYAIYGIAKRRGARERRDILHRWFFVFAAALLGWFAADIVKGIVAAPRPFLELSDVTLLFPYGDHDSFPSGHAAFLSGLVAALSFFLPAEKKAFRILLAVTILVGLARVAAGIHWPFDILGGMLFGTAAAYTLFRARIYFK